MLPKDRPLKIVDFGCGKAYLTFALYYYVVKILNMQAEITGLDLKEEVIDYCNKVAIELGYDSLEFQKGNIKDYSRTQDVDMVIMIATLLHSVATGNLIPARIKSVCVDISNASVTKLSDRGSAQVISVVTDIGSFLPILKEELNKLEE